VNRSIVEGIGMDELPYGICQCYIMFRGSQGIARWERGRRLHGVMQF